MQEIKKPRKPLIYYYVIVLAVLLLFNFLIMPWAAERRIREVGYETFMEMTESRDIGKVEIDQSDNEILFTNKDGDQIYKTGMVEDADLTQRLYESGAKFSGQILEQTSPVLTFLLYWILPILIFVGIGQYMSRKLMNKASGGLRKELSFPMWRVKTRRRRISQRSWIISTTRRNIKKSAHPCRRASFW